MTLTLGELERIVEEAAPLVRERTVLAFRDEGPAAFRLLLEGGEDRPPRILRLLLCARPGLDRIHLTPRPAGRRKHAPPTPFARAVEERIAGARLEEMELEGRDRVVRLRFRGADGSSWTLAAELIGRHANLVLVDGEGTVRALVHPFRGKRRTLEAGAPYVPLPPPEGTRRRPPPPRFEPGAAPSWPAAPWSGAADEFYRALEERDAEEHLRRGLRRRLRRRLRREEEKAARLRAEAEEAARAEEWKRRGDLLQAHYHLLARGMDAVEVEDLFAPEGGRVTLPLDPARDPRENVAACYRRYRKAKAAGPRIEALLEASKAVQAELRALLERLEHGADPAALEREAAPLLPAPAAPERASPARKRAEPEPGTARRFRTPEGFLIYVGRDGPSSDRLTFRFARGNDLWLHCKDRPGAHVVIRGERGKSVPLRALLDGGLLAVHFSKLRGASKAEVIYTPCKYVHRVKGGPPGKVTVERHKTLHVKADPERLARLLEGAPPPGP